MQLPPCSLLGLSGLGEFLWLLGNDGLLLLGLLSSLGSLEGGLGLGTIILRSRLENRVLLLGLDDSDCVGKGLGGAGLALGVRSAHNLDLDTEDTLAEEDVASGRVDEVASGLTGVDHETILNPSQYATKHLKNLRRRTVNFMDLARAALNLPETTTSQPLAPDSIMKRRTP